MREQIISDLAPGAALGRVGTVLKKRAGSVIHHDPEHVGVTPNRLESNDVLLQKFCKFCLLKF